MKETICWTCKNYITCDWGKYDETTGEVTFKLIDGWKAIYNEERDSYTVLDCPQYESDKKKRKLPEYTCQCGALVVGRKTCPACLARRNEYQKERRIALKNGNVLRKTKEYVFKFSDNTCDAARIAIQARYDEIKDLHGSARDAMRHKIYREAGCCACGRKLAKGKYWCEKCYEREKKKGRIKK